MTLHQNFIAGSWIDGTEAAEACALALDLLLTADVPRRRARTTPTKGKGTRP